TRLSQRSHARRQIRIGSMLLTFEESVNFSDGPRFQHGVQTLGGHRVDHDVRWTIGKAHWSIGLGVMLSRSNSQIRDLETNQYGYFLVHMGRTTIILSNDTFAGPNDHGYTQVVSVEHDLARPRSYFGGRLQLTGARLRIVGTTGIRNELGPTLHIG